MKILLVAAMASAALLVAPLTIGSADAQTVVIKRGHGPHHGHFHGPRKKVVIIKDRRRHGWHGHHPVRRGHMHHHRGTVGVGVR